MAISIVSANSFNRRPLGNNVLDQAYGFIGDGWEVGCSFFRTLTHMPKFLHAACFDALTVETTEQFQRLVSAQNYIEALQPLTTNLALGVLTIDEATVVLRALNARYLELVPRALNCFDALSGDEQFELLAARFEDIAEGDVAPKVDVVRK